MWGTRWIKQRQVWQSGVSAGTTAAHAKFLGPEGPRNDALAFSQRPLRMAEEEAGMVSVVAERGWTAARAVR